MRWRRRLLKKDYKACLWRHFHNRDFKMMCKKFLSILKLFSIFRIILASLYLDSSFLYEKSLINNLTRCVRLEDRRKQQNKNCSISSIWFFSATNEEKCIKSDFWTMEWQACREQHSCGELWYSEKYIEHLLYKKLDAPRHIYFGWVLLYTSLLPIRSCTYESYSTSWFEYSMAANKY